MAINVNIDNQLGLEYAFKIAGKKREITFTDECALEMERVELTVGNILDRVDKLSDKDLEDKSVEEQVEYVSSMYKEIKDTIIPFFDKYLGDNSGQEIYEYVHESTRALSTIFGKISSYLNKVEINSDKSKESKK